MPQRRRGNQLRRRRHAQMMAARCQNGFHRLGDQVVLVAIFSEASSLLPASRSSTSSG
jgi:hypothetical protein